jgi:hypothetical protein
MDMVGLDFIGPITPTSTNGNRYIIIMVDYFSRHLFARAAATSTGTVAKGLFLDVVNIFGWPRAVYTDNGSHFVGSEFHSMLVTQNVKHFPAPKTHPSSVGLAERYVQLLMGILKRRIQSMEKTSWDTLIMDAVGTLNMRALRVHGFTPSELLLGYKPREPSGTTVEDLVIMDGLEKGLLSLRLTNGDETRSLAGIKTTAMADKLELQDGGDWSALQEGDLVLLRRFEVVKHHGLKLEPLWEGPYELCEMAYQSRSGRLRDITTQEIVKTRKGGLKERVHVNDLKLFNRRDLGRLPGLGNQDGTNPVAHFVELAELRLASDWEPGNWIVEFF